MGLTREEIETVVAQTLLQLREISETGIAETLRQLSAQEIAERIYVTENPTPNPRYTWTGWMTGTDVTPEEPGKEWLVIEDYGEEMAIIVVRADASIFENDQPGLAAERARKVAEAEWIVTALNALEEERRGRVGTSG